MSEELRHNICIRFGERIRELRRLNRVSQEGLATLAGVHRTYIGMVERGEKNVTILTMARLAAALNVDLVTLIKGL